ncbi:hypothetical protein ZHS_72 [Edwardsiella phage vB_EpM_ZHS]|jgi:hypothetical protein|nr:hypothetical protein ZHS_72 [Edwardsiella phage vB_EpM_ZHS]
MHTPKEQPDPLLQALKQKAWNLKKATPGMKHAEALDQIAQEQGFPNWMRFLQDHKGG